MCGFVELVQRLMKRRKPRNGNSFAINIRFGALVTLNRLLR
jgi:hypothetical protein